MGFYSQIISLTDGRTLNNADMEKAKQIFCEENLASLNNALESAEPEKQEVLKAKIKTLIEYLCVLII
jgi:hypothetical protein